MIELERTVGEHHGKGKQLHVPLEVLDKLGVEPGDAVEFSAVENGCVMTAKET